MEKGQKKAETEQLRTALEALGGETRLTVTAEDGSVLGKVSAEELRKLLGEERTETRELFYRRLLDGELAEADIFPRAANLGIRSDVQRIVYLIELGRAGESGERAQPVCGMLRQLYSEAEAVIALSPRTVAMVRAIRGKKELDTLSEEAGNIVSTINTELMETARIAYGNAATELSALPQSLREARLAMEVAEVFYGEREIVSYAELGIGRLIYELPEELCGIFLEEVFGDSRRVRLEEQEILTVNKFFEKNLNLSETARELYIHRNTLVYHLEKLQKRTGLDIRSFDDAVTLKIALMVKRYIEYKAIRH